MLEKSILTLIGRRFSQIYIDNITLNLRILIIHVHLCPEI